MNHVRRNLPVILGGVPAFAETLGLIRPMVPSAAELAPYLAEIEATGIASNFGPFCRRYEETLAEMLGVEHCLSLSNLSTGLTYMPRAAGLESGEVIVPSFTFAATAHSMVLGGLTPIFADIDAESLTLDPESVEAAIGPDTVAVCGVHIYGTPCHVVRLEKLCQRHGLALFFDSAHGLGSKVKGVPLGRFGLAEGFSTSVTKVMTTFGEGGFITTDDDDFAEGVRTARNWGHTGDYNSRFPSVGSKMPEIAAAAGLIMLPRLAANVAARSESVRQAETLLAEVPGISFPEVGPDDYSGHKDFAVLVDGDAFGLDRDQLAAVLAAENVQTRAYYAPPLHHMEAYSRLPLRVPLPVTDEMAGKALCLPLHNEMPADVLALICQTIAEAHGSAPEIAERLGSQK